MPDVSPVATHRFVYGLADPGSPPDLWMKDEPTHMGTDLWGGTSWDSPDLWVRVSDDGGLDHQSPEFGQDNWFYARVRNRGAAAAHYAVVFNEKPYAGFEFVYPDDDLPCAAAVADFDLGPGESRVVKARWPAGLVPPAGAHACLLAAAMARADHPTTGVHVWEDNNLAQKNLTVVDMFPGDWIVLPFVALNRRREWFPWFDLVLIRPRGFEALRSDLLYLRRKVHAPSADLLECGGTPSAKRHDYEPWTSRNPEAALAEHSRETREQPFPEGARGRLGLSLPFNEQLMLGWRVRVPDDARPGTLLRMHLLKRNRFGRRTQGGIALHIRVREG